MAEIAKHPVSDWVSVGLCDIYVIISYGSWAYKKNKKCEGTTTKNLGVD